MTVTSLNGSCGGGAKRAASAAEGATEEEEAARDAELVLADVEVAGGADLVAAAVSPRCLLAPSSRARCSASRARADSCFILPTTPIVRLRGVRHRYRFAY